MYKTPAETGQFLAKFTQLAKGVAHCEVVIFPTALSIAAAVEGIAGSSLQGGAQNVDWTPEAPFTGEVSAEMMRAAGATWTLVGHSERRHQVCHETDAEVLKKAQAALSAGLTPIISVGEKL